MTTLREEEGATDTQAHGVEKGWGDRESPALPRSQKEDKLLSECPQRQRACSSAGGPHLSEKANSSPAGSLPLGRVWMETGRPEGRTSGGRWDGTRGENRAELTLDAGGLSPLGHLLPSLLPQTLHALPAAAAQLLETVPSLPGEL